MSTDQTEKKKKRVLIVDDDKDLLSILTIQFESLGAEVLAISDSTIALKTFIKNSINAKGFDLIALDINMPEMDGNELAMKIREAGYEGKIVALTADVTGDGRMKSKSSGIDYYMGKLQANKNVLSALLEM